MIPYQIISTTGIEKREKEVSDAIVDIQNHTSKHHSWLYVDGTPTNPNTLTAEQLESAGNITLTHATIGG